jgi:hypothetical protein
MSKERLHMSNEQGDGGGTFSELLRLQTEFQTRLAEETLNYLRRVQGAAAPASPGTVLVPQDGDALTAAGTLGSTVQLQLDVENRQRVHCVVTPMLSPLVNSEGVTWFPAATPSPSTLIAPGQTRTIVVAVPISADLPPATYRGALVLRGFGERGVAVAIEAKVAGSPPAARKPATAKARARKTKTRARGTQQRTQRKR